MKELITRWTVQVPEKRRKQMIITGSSAANRALEVDGRMLLLCWTRSYVCWGDRLHVCLYINTSLHTCGRVDSAYFIIPVPASCSPAPFIMWNRWIVCCSADVIWCVNICSSLFCAERCIIRCALTHFLSLAIQRLIFTSCSRVLDMHRLTWCSFLKNLRQTYELMLFHCSVFVHWCAGQN